jgi:hypothetical protein
MRALRFGDCSIEMTKFGCENTRNLCVQGQGPLHRTAARTSYGTRFRRERFPGLAAPAHTVPYGTVLSGDASQALRAWLRSYCPSGTKYILRPEALITLALMGFETPG